SVVVILAVVGIVSGSLRGIFRRDLMTRVDPIRTVTMEKLKLRDPFVAQRAAELARIDDKYAAHPWATYLHVVPGTLLLALVPFQFSRRIRRRHLRFHRWSGRLLVLFSFCAGASALTV